MTVSIKVDLISPIDPYNINVTDENLTVDVFDGKLLNLLEIIGNKFLYTPMTPSCEFQINSIIKRFLRCFEQKFGTTTSLSPHLNIDAGNISISFRVNNPFHKPGICKVCYPFITVNSTKDMFDILAGGEHMIKIIYKYLDCKGICK